MSFPGGPTPGLYPDAYGQTQHVQPSVMHSFQSQGPTHPVPLTIHDSPYAIPGPGPTGYQTTSPINIQTSGYFPQSTPSHSPIQPSFSTPTSPYPSYSPDTTSSSSYPTYSSGASSPTSVAGVGGYSTAQHPQQTPTQGSNAQYYGNTVNVASQPAYNGYAPTSPALVTMSQQQTTGFPGQYQPTQRDEYSLSSQDTSRIPPGESMATIDNYM